MGVKRWQMPLKRSTSFELMASLIDVTCCTVDSDEHLSTQKRLLKLHSVAQCLRAQLWRVSLKVQIRGCNMTFFFHLYV